METPSRRNLAYFQGMLTETDPYGATTLSLATQVLDDPREINAFLVEFVAMQFARKSPPSKGTLRTQITELTCHLDREITIKSPNYSMQKLLSAVWWEAMNSIPSLKA